MLRLFNQDIMLENYTGCTTITRALFDPFMIKVDDLMARIPATMAVSTAFGIDSGCGAQRSVHIAALDDGADGCALIEALDQAIGRPA